MFAKSITFDIETLHAGKAVQIFYPAVNNRNFEKRMTGIILEAKPLELKIAYYDPKATMIKRGTTYGLVRRIFTLEEVVNRKIEFIPLSPH
jgi:hypothetical protein